MTGPRERVARHLRGNAVAYVALFAALGGTSYAASQLPPNSVGAKQIRPDAVGRSEIRKDAVLGSELAAKSIGRENLRAGIISPEHLGFVVTRANANGAATTATKTIKQSNGFFNAGSFTLPAAPPAKALIHASVQVSDEADGNPSAVIVRVRHNDHFEPVTASQTLADGATATVPVELWCNGVDPGANDFTLEVGTVGAGNLTVGPRSIDAVSFRAIPNPP